MVESGDLVLTNSERPPLLDVQTALTIIGRRNTSFDNTVRLNLTQTRLSGYTLGYANLEGAGLTEADLAEVDLIEADLTGVGLSGANLTGSIMQ